MANSSRDEFSESTRRLLEDRVRSHCSNPDCNCPTSGPGSTDDSITRIGCASHITAASLGGPRYDPKLTSAERRSAQNGIWLCCNCHVLVDRDEGLYPVDLLVQWKEYSEHMRRCEVEGKVKLDLEGDSCGWCGTLVSTGLRVCTGCSAEVIAGSSSDERKSDFREGASVAGVTTLMMLGIPTIINNNIGYVVPEYWGLSVLVVVPLTVGMALLFGSCWAMRKDQERANNGVRFFRYSQI